MSHRLSRGLAHRITGHLYRWTALGTTQVDVIDQEGKVCLETALSPHRLVCWLCGVWCPSLGFTSMFGHLELLVGNSFVGGRRWSKPAHQQHCSPLRYLESLHVLSLLGPVPRDSHACISYHPRHAANVCLGSVQSRTNVRLGVTSQQLLLQVQLRIRFTLRHTYSHGGNVGNHCADHAAALGALGFVSSKNVVTRWVALLLLHD